MSTSGKRLTISSFITKASKVHDNKYKYLPQPYKNNRTQVGVLCNAHGVFFITPASHLKGVGCKQCRGIKVYDTKSFIKEATAKHKDKYDYTKVVYKRAQDNINIICPIHGKFSQTPFMHIRSTGCIQCSKVPRKSTEEYIAKAREKHGETFLYDKTVFSIEHSSIVITCKIHGDFTQSAHNHLAGNGCPKCKKSGFNPELPAIMYYLRINKGTAYKIGITNRTVFHRFSSKDMKSIEVLKEWKFDKGIDALNAEAKILRENKADKYKGSNLLSSGNTELFCRNILEIERPLQCPSTK